MIGCIGRYHIFNNHAFINFVLYFLLLLLYKLLELLLPQRHLVHEYVEGVLVSLLLLLVVLA